MRDKLSSGPEVGNFWPGASCAVTGFSDGYLEIGSVLASVFGSVGQELDRCLEMAYKLKEKVASKRTSAE